MINNTNMVAKRNSEVRNQCLSVQCLEIRTGGKIKSKYTSNWNQIFHQSGFSCLSLSTYLNFLSLFSVALTWGPIDHFKNAIYIPKTLFLDNSTFERVEEFKYLGTTLTNRNSIPEEIKSRLRSGNACYHSVQNLLSSRLLSKNLKIKIYVTIIFLLFCMGVKLGHWQCGRKESWGCLRTWCWGEYLDLGGMR